MGFTGSSTGSVSAHHKQACECRLAQNSTEDYFYNVSSTVFLKRKQIFRDLTALKSRAYKASFKKNSILYFFLVL